LRSVARWCEERTCPNRAARWYKSIYTEVGGEPAHYSPSNPVLRCALAGARINAGEPFSDFAQCTFISSCPCKAPLDEVEEKMISPRLPHPSIQDQLHTDGTVRECDRMQWAIGVSLVLARDCGGHITASRASCAHQVSQYNTVQQIHLSRRPCSHRPSSSSPSRFRSIIVNQPPTNDVPVCEVLGPAFHVLALSKSEIIEFVKWLVDWR